MIIKRSMKKVKYRGEKRKIFNKKESIACGTSNQQDPEDGEFS